MKSISQEFEKSLWKDRRGDLRNVPESLRIVARAFRELQEERHEADYNNHRQWSARDVHDRLQLTHEAFDSWAQVRADSMAGNYLIAMLLGK